MIRVLTKLKKTKQNKTGIRPSTKNINNMLSTKFLIYVTLLAFITVI